MSETVEFGRLFSEALRNGVSYASKFRGTGTPMINMREIFAHDRIVDVECELAPITEKQRENYLLKEDDLLFARQSLTYEGAGKCSIILPSEEERTWESHLIRARLDTEVACPHYYYYYFRSPQGRLNIETIIQQVAAAGIRGSDLTRLKVPYPPLAQQQAIAEVLGALDDKIDANSKLAAICDDLALSLLHSCPVSVPVGEIVTYKKGSIDVSALQAATVAHFSLPAFDAGKLPELCGPNDIKSNKAHVEAPSVLISKLNPRFPRVWNLPELPSEPAVASTEFLVLEPKFSSTSVLWAILSQEKFGRELETQVAGTSGSHQRVRPADLLATKTIDPRDLSNETQHLITTLCHTSFHSRDESRQLEATRDALLPQLISGKLRVKDTEKVLENAL